MHPVHTFPSNFPNIHSSVFSHLRLGLPSGLFLSGFPAKLLYAFLICPLRSTCPAHLIFLDLTTLITFGEVYKLWSSSLCSLLQPPATPPPPPLISSAPCSQIPSL
jgi:hypothetical protein